MSSLVKSFTNNTLNINLTIIKIDDQIWFIAKEVAELLEYTSTQKALQIVKDKYKRLFKYDDLQGIFQNNQNGCFEIPNRGLTLVTKSGLIQMVLNSTKPEAEAFQDWVLEEVIPSVLENGSYNVRQQMLPQDYISALRALADAEERKQQLVLENKFITEQKELAEAQRAEAIRTKAHISDKKTAKAMATASKFSRENKILKAENRALKDGWYTKYDIKNLLSFPYELSELSKAKKALELSKVMSKVLNTLNPSGIYQRMFTCGTVTNKGKEYPMTEYRFSYEVVDFLVPWLKQNPYLLRMRKYWEDSMFQFCKPYFSKML